MFVLTALTALTPEAAGLLPSSPNKVVIHGRFSQPAPALVLVFSAEPLKDSRGAPAARLTVPDLAAMKSHRDRLALNLYSKQVSGSGQLEYAFGNTADGSAPWNAGPDFRWGDWEQYSADVWDNLSIASPGGPAVITDVTVTRGGKLLYDSRARKSFPNGYSINPAFPPADLTPQQGSYPVLNLGSRMERFRRDFYELGSSQILRTAYSDLAQTDKRKYANRGNAWCSEFSSHVYRQCGIMTPDPNRSDVHWKSMRAFFQQSGQVFPAREVASWPDERKIAVIKPGSFVSILIGESTHSIIFTGWVTGRGRPITTYVGVSGNNKGMVWPHAPMKLPTSDTLARLSPEALRDFDDKVYFAVPRDLK
jgi:hypothetical protein